MLSNYPASTGARLVPAGWSTTTKQGPPASRPDSCQPLESEEGDYAYSGSSESLEEGQEWEEEEENELDGDVDDAIQAQEIDELDGSVHVVKHLPHRPHTQVGQETEQGDASDYYPSDAEEEMPIHSKLSAKTLRHYVERSAASRERITQAISSSGLFHPSFRGPDFQYAQMRKYNFEERRWVNKGPVLLYFLPPTTTGRASRLIAHYLYGTKSIALNLEIWELWTRYLASCNRRSVAFSTCGYNAVMDANITSIKTLLGHLLRDVPPESQYLPVESCCNNVCAVPELAESRGSIFHLQFVQEHDREQFMYMCHQHVEVVRRLRLAERVETYMNGPYAQYRHFAEELGTAGLVDTQEGTGATGCSKCGAHFPQPWDLYTTTKDTVRALHRQHPVAIQARCPFAYEMHEGTEVPPPLPDGGVGAPSGDAMEC